MTSSFFISQNYPTYKNGRVMYVFINSVIWLNIGHVGEGLLQSEMRIWTNFENQGKDENFLY
jgi:hypothetical protein